MPSQRRTKLVLGALKPFLREVCIPSLAKQSLYFPIREIKLFLEQHNMPAISRTLVGYLHELVASGFIHAAGRGWYSQLAPRFTIDTSSVKSLADELIKAFPLVSLSCWSTAQVQGAMHHLLGKFVTFVMLEADAMETVGEYLRDSGWDVWINPRGKDVDSFVIRGRTVVLRRASSKSPSTEPLASIEKILVELFFETLDLHLMAAADYQAMLENLAGTRRIQMAVLISYAAERKLQLGDIFGKESQLIPPKEYRRK